MKQLNKDWVIPKGTVFQCIDGTERKFGKGNYEAVLSTNLDSSMSIIINDDMINDNKELFIN